MEKRQMNYEHFEKEKIIKISDLIEEMLQKIWKVVIAAVVVAIVVAGYKYAQDKATISATNAMTQVDTETSLNDEELQEVNNIAKLQQSADNQQAYVDNSILMKINPYAEDRTSMEFVVKGDRAVVSSAISSLKYYVSENILANDLKEKYTDVDPSYLSELISFVTKEDEDVKDNSAQNDEVDSDTIVFCICVVQTDASACEELAADVEACVNNYKAQTEQKIGSYELELLNKSQTTVFDSSLLSYQITKINDLMNLKTSVENSKSHLTDVQLSAIENNTIESDETVDSNTQQVVMTAHISKKYAGIGAVAGAILALIIIMIRYIVRGTVNVEVEFRRMFGLRIFGHLDLDSKANILVKAWRRLLNRRKAIPLDDEKNMLLKNVTNFCKKNNIDKILLAGCFGESASNEWATELTDLLEMQNIKVKMVCDFPYSSDSIDFLNEYEHIVLVECLKKARYEDVKNAIQESMEQGCCVEGVIVLN